MITSPLHRKIYPLTRIWSRRFNNTKKKYLARSFNQKIIIMKKTQTLLCLMLLLLGVQAFGQGVTSATIRGSIKGGSEPLIGANVTLVHEPTSMQYGNISNTSGRFVIPSVRVGGPYTLRVSYVGYQSYEAKDIYLSLGQELLQNVTLQEVSTELAEIIVTSAGNKVINSDRTGSETTINEQEIAVLPTVSRNLQDFLRLSPNLGVGAEGGLFIAGMNKRYNAIYYDGAVNNDILGLEPSGFNGAVLGPSISIDAIEQVTVSTSPFDVSLGGFGGGVINAVTRSGTNTLEGSAYYFFRNEDLAGKTPTEEFGLDRERLDPFTSNIYGLRLGGPIIKDKLFFFANVEIAREEIPQPFDFATYRGDATRADLEAIQNKLRNNDTYPYDPGTFESNNVDRERDNYFLKLDYNLSEAHKITLRHSYVGGNFIAPAQSSPGRIAFSNQGQNRISEVNSTALEVNSIFGSNFSNNLILGFTKTVDDRDQLGGEAAFLNIDDGPSGNIFVGSDINSSANERETSIFSITDNFKIYKGKHTITLGTHNEFYTVRNLFIRPSFGYYYYDTVEDFLNDTQPTRFRLGYSLFDDTSVYGDASSAAQEFSGALLGLYAQDDFQVSDKLKLSLGLRADLPVFSDEPVADSYFNDTTLGLLATAGVDAAGARAGEMPSGNVQFSPRFSFNYDVFGNQTTQIRGGIGMFTSRFPYIWVAEGFVNNGIAIGNVDERNAELLKELSYNPDPNFNQQYTSTFFGGADARGGTINLYSEDFKFPQFFKASLGLDHQFKSGLIFTLENTFTQTIQDVKIRNLNLRPAIGNLEGTIDNRPIFNGGDRIDPTYSQITLLENTNEGYAYNVMAQIQKPFQNDGFSYGIAYSYTTAKSVFEGGSSSAGGNWNGLHAVNGRNITDGAQFNESALGSRFVGFLAKKFDYLNHFSTTVSLFYNGQDGKRFSYIYADDGDLTNEGGADRNLMFVPAASDQIALVDDGSRTVEQQWEDLNAYIERDDYLSERRGQYAERNGARTPFESVLDLRILQDFYIQTGTGRKHTLQVSLDIFNFTNFLNKNWGLRYNSPENFEVLSFEGFQDGINIPTFTFPERKNNEQPWTINDTGTGTTGSRWTAQLGLRYIF